MQLLLAEDEQKTVDYLTKGLRENGHVVEAVNNGPDALALAMAGTFDAMILDVMMPGLDGWEVLKRLRAAGRATPVLFLTARDHVEDRVRGLDLGANDYLIKPFAFAELLARLRNLARLPRAVTGGALVSVGDLEIDTLRHRVTRAGHVLQLTSKEYALLLLLARNQGRVLSRTLIAEAIWGLFHDQQSNAVDALVRRLRTKLDTPFASALLHTIRGTGYVLDI
ncbi:response regulator [Acidocella aminolytica]|jgi:two-component system copper resistance phosphate regulon response regulator CusR|uniref:Two component transcriptional regulator heavy metal response n=1 Tax=Acidocella aminolytica 101 = DSM 11237 TaxID=1120923 RepID=A0A0D6PH02_9PROT|nr:response regulator [Acidocella aminolytica]GAN80947.1 two component transcriptional regulator heavy metal response [Acidocella aminolytica 101 = DSM 11237]GBQ43320.1 two component response regulator [Acidocella aminolytica 101 = DSM 11237]SHF31561.1 two-component system, OmpR family, copper resistance phosphate regulon response regulator CusR [Acidocella aminolytica 101 = DSM 11237]